MLDIQRILYPTDFSDTARSAVGHALLFAKQFDAQLHMLNVVGLGQPSAGGFEVPLPADEQLLEQLFELADSKFDQLRQLPGAKTLEIIENKRYGYTPGPEILDYADEIDADLIVMGSHGRRGPARWVLGSVAEKVLRRAACPVVTVHPKQNEIGTDPLRPIRNILVPLDFSSPSNLALTSAKELAARNDGRLVLLHVVDTDTLPAFYGAAMDEITERLTERSLTELRLCYESTPGPEVPYEPVTIAGRAAATIVDFAEHEGSDLIVIPSLGRTGISRWLVGSTAERVVRSAPCPVLTLKEPYYSDAETQPQPVNATATL